MIKRLDAGLINLIAAGEVVERPKSVVKELIENAIDAGATAITIETDAGGKGYIRVTDDGRGMDADDLLVCYHQHTTSKIEKEQDLFHIASLGFRGEALASIAAVSRVEIASRTEGSETGKKVVVEGGILRFDEQVGMPAGTIVTVKNLFFNTPARLRHLSSDRTELSKMTDIVTRYALSREDLAIILKSNGKEILNVPKGPLINKIVTIYGKETAKQMIPLSFRSDRFIVSGYISKPYLARKERTYQTIFVNGRYVKSESISNALYDAYHTLLFLDRHPACVLMIEIDLSKTDVNVHPQKEIIRIEDEELLYEQMFSGIREALQQNDLIPQVGLSGNPSSRKPTKQYAAIKEKQELLAEPQRSYPQKDPQPARFSSFRILGQLNRLYILAESHQGLVLIDQHAAQERWRFETYMRQYHQQEIESQTLLSPHLIDLSPAHASLVRKHQAALEKLGFTIESFGNQTFKISKVPRIIGEFTQALLMDTLEELKGTSIVERIEEKIAMRACKSSVKAGEALTVPEMRKILDDLGTCEKPYACPHGRPTIITITLADIEKYFKRAG